MSNSNDRILYSSISYQELKKVSKLVVSGIYKIENLINHKVYIGQSKDIYQRWYTHKRASFNKNCNKCRSRIGFCCNNSYGC